jgi:uncharacterized repeat protein (TIGR01451 family)
MRLHRDGFLSFRGRTKGGHVAPRRTRERRRSPWLEGLERRELLSGTVAEYPTGSVPSIPAQITSSPDHNIRSADLQSHVRKLTVAAPVLSLQVGASASSVPLGNSFHYTVTVTNSGGADATNVVMTARLPDGFNYTSPVTAGVSFDGLHTVTYTIPDLQPGDANAATLTMSGYTSKTGTLGGTSTVATLSVQSDSTPPTAPQNFPAVTVVAPTATLTITGHAPTTPVHPGDRFTYSFNMTNAGPADDSNLSVAIQLPAGVSYTGPTGASGTGSFAYNSALDIVTYTQSSVPASAATTVVNLPVTVAATVDTTKPLNASAQVLSDLNPNAPGFRFPTVTLATATPPTPIDLSITQATFAPSLKVGDALAYVVTVTKPGSGTAKNVRVSETFNLSDTKYLGTFEQTGGTTRAVTTVNVATDTVKGTETVTYLLGDMSQPTDKFFFLVSATQAGPLSVPTATVTSDTPDPNQNNNSAYAGKTVLYFTNPAAPATPASLYVAVQLETGADRPLYSGSITVGRPLYYVITVRNNGPMPLAYDPKTKTGALTLTNVLPAGMDVIFGRENGVDFFPSKTGQTISLNLLGGPGSNRVGSLAPYQSIQIVIEVRARLDAYRAAVSAGSWSVTDTATVAYTPSRADTATGPGSQSATDSHSLKGSGVGNGPDSFVTSLFAMTLGRFPTQDELYFYGVILVYLDHANPSGAPALTGDTVSANEQTVGQAVWDNYATERARYVAAGNTASSLAAAVLQGHKERSSADMLDLFGGNSLIRDGYAYQ